MHLQLFGRPQLQGLASAGGRAAQRQRLALLALLATARDSGVTRDRLVGLLWPEAETARARHLLSNSVYVLRQALGSDVITASADGLRLDAARLPSDVGKFLDALDRGDDEVAVQHCGSPFMEGFFLPDAGEFEQWLEAERDRLARACAAAHERLGERAEAAGDDRAAAERWRRLAGMDPYSSRVALRLMETLIRAGEPGAAVAHARQHTRRLREELGAEPAPEITALAATLGQPAWTAATPVVSAPPGAAQHAPGFDDAPPVSPVGSAPGARPIRRGAGAVVTVVVLILIGGVVLQRRESFGALSAAGTANAESARSVAVLPFVNVAPDAQDEYFSDGLTEELITRLSQMKDLRVAARTSAFAFKGVNADITEIGRKLNVAYVVEGSVRRTGDRVRITVQLVKVDNGFQVWSKTYEHRALADVFRIQDDISRQIVANLLPNLRPASLPAHGTSNVAAFDQYAKGRFAFWQGATLENLSAAIQHYQAALELDAGYALAYAGLADAYMLLPGRPDENLPRARAAALRALELDDNLSEGYVALASINWFYDWDWEAAERNYRRSFSVNRVVYTRCICYVWYLYVLGDTEAAIREAERARALDPAGLLPLSTLAGLYLASGRTQDLRVTIEQLRDAGAGSDEIRHLHTWLAWREGRLADALALIEDVRAGRTIDEFVRTEGSYAAAGYAIIYADAGRTAEARAIAGTLKARAAEQYVPSVQLAAAFGAAGDTAEASRWIRAAYDARANLAFFQATLQSTPLRDLPAFRAVLDSVGVPDR